METFPDQHDFEATVKFCSPLLRAIRAGLDKGIQARETIDPVYLKDTDPDPCHSTGTVRRIARGYLASLGHPHEGWTLVRSVGFSGIRICWGPMNLKVIKATPDGCVRPPLTPTQEAFYSQEPQLSLALGLPGGGYLSPDGGNLIARWLEAGDLSVRLGLCRPNGVWKGKWQEAETEWDVWPVDLPEDEEGAFPRSVRTGVPAASILDEADYRLASEES